jgi:hypothetical protein
MKKTFLFFACFFALSLFYGCVKKDEPLPSESLNFVGLRQVVDQTPFIVIDDSASMTTTVVFNNQTIISETWQQDIYSGPIIKTRLLWTRSKSDLNFIIIGHNNLFYQKLMKINTHGDISSYKIEIINLLKSELRENKAKIWFKYNNSWTRTGKIPDSEIQINI